MEVRDLFQSDAWYSGVQASRIEFGPDGKVYMVIGVPTRQVVGKAESAQDPSDHAGKMLRLNDDGTVPTTIRLSIRPAIARRSTPWASETPWG